MPGSANALASRSCCRALAREIRARLGLGAIVEQEIELDFLDQPDTLDPVTELDGGVLEYELKSRRTPTTVVESTTSQTVTAPRTVRRRGTRREGIERNLGCEGRACQSAGDGANWDNRAPLEFSR